MLEEIKSRPCIWVYELCSNKTGELRTVLSRKFIKEVSTKGWKYYKCIAYFDFQGEYCIF